MASSFPNLPGYLPTHKVELNPSFRKVSATKQEQIRDNKNEVIPDYPLPREAFVAEPNQSGAFNPNYMSTTHDSFKPLNTGVDVTKLYIPTWVKLDKHVLRYSGFFKESVNESALENHRVRKLVVFFYLEDGSVSINEPKQTNSGIPQGAFFKRQKVLKADGKFLSIFDFRIGQEVEIYGKTILIHDCDEYTREFYEKLNYPQPEPFEAPKDSFEIKTLTKHIPQKDHMMKDFMEHKLGGGRVTSQKQFLENDRKVLKFNVYSGIPYIMHYYLADDTIEIREVNFANSGRDPFPLLLKRQKLPRKFSLNQPGQTSEESYIRPHDIVDGDILEIFGRKFKIDGCDVFTHDFYNEKYGINFPIKNIEKPIAREFKTLMIPPYNGFGDEEDSLGYVYRLLPKAPKKDYFKWMDNQIYLRYYAKFNTKAPEDIDRRFIITFFMHDDTILVYEPEQRNSGISSGKFLEKGKYKNVEKGNNYFNPSDLLAGKDVKINGFSFHILDCDDVTRKWYAEFVGTNEFGQPLQLGDPKLLTKTVQYNNTGYNVQKHELL